MKSLKDIDLLNLQTANMKEDSTTKAICAALNSKYRQMGSDINKCLIYSRIDDLNESLLDELAFEMKIDWYDATANIEIKRQLIRTAPDIKAHLGTPYAVEKVIEIYFGDGYTQDWFEYGGEPGMFKVLTNNSSVTGDKAELFTKVLEKVKRKSAHLEAIIIALSGDMNMYYAGVVHTGDFIEIRQVV
jgi:phage tail P2-like protein